MSAPPPAYQAYRDSLAAKGITEAEDLEGNGKGKSDLQRWEEVFYTAEGLFSISNREFPETQWIVKDILPRGTFTLLSGGSKIGKTWLVLQLASAVSLGGGFLGNADYPCAQAEVLLMSLQLSSRQLHDRLEKASILADDRVQVLHAWEHGEAALEMLRYYCTRNPECRLVIIDMLQNVRDVDAQFENSYSERVKEFSKWSRLAQELDICIVGLTHDRKQWSSDFVQNSMGSVGNVGSSGTIWGLYRSRGKADATLNVTGWDIAEMDLPLVFDISTGWQLLEGTASERKKSEEQAAVLGILSESDEPLGAKDIAEALNMKEGNVRWHLSQLKRTGAAQNTARGKYAVISTNKLTNYNH